MSLRHARNQMRIHHFKEFIKVVANPLYSHFFLQNINSKTVEMWYVMITFEVLKVFICSIINGFTLFGIKLH